MYNSVASTTISHIREYTYNGFNGFGHMVSTPQISIQENIAKRINHSRINFYEYNHIFTNEFNFSDK